MDPPTNLPPGEYRIVYFDSKDRVLATDGDAHLTIAEDGSTLPPPQAGRASDDYRAQRDALRIEKLQLGVLSGHTHAKAEAEYATLLIAREQSHRDQQAHANKAIQDLLDKTLAQTLTLADANLRVLEASRATAEQVAAMAQALRVPAPPPPPPDWVGLGKTIVETGAKLIATYRLTQTGALAQTIEAKPAPQGDSAPQGGASSPPTIAGPPSADALPERKPEAPKALPSKGDEPADPPAGPAPQSGPSVPPADAAGSAPPPAGSGPASKPAPPTISARRAESLPWDPRRAWKQATRFLLSVDNRLLSLFLTTPNLLGLWARFLGKIVSPPGGSPLQAVPSWERLLPGGAL